MTSRRALTEWAMAAIVATLSLIVPACSSDEPTTPAGSTESASTAGDRALAGVEMLRQDVLVSGVLETATDDLPTIVERRTLRVLTDYSPTTFFMAKGRAQGFEVEMMRAYVDFVNEELGNPRYPLKVVFVPAPVDRLIDALENGRGDIIAAGMTVTPQRSERASFAEPYLPEVSEVIATRAGTAAADATELAQLSGTTVHVVKGSSYVESLAAANARLDAAGQKPIDVVEVDEEISSADLLELVNAGVIDATVVDLHIGRAWTAVLPELVVREDLELTSGGSLAWAVRKSNPELLASLNRFVRAHQKGTLMGNMLFKRYFEDEEALQNPLSESERARFEKLAEHFQQEAETHDIDWLLLAAQAYRESRLEQELRSPAGAVGIMQIKPTTAKEVGIDDISTAEANIRAGAAYLSYLRDRYFSDDAIPPDDQVRFALAAYNMGPARMIQMRKLAAEQGFDPNRWFGQVEHVTRAEVGREPVDYVADIQRYYVAYKLVLRARAAKQDALEGL